MIVGDDLRMVVRAAATRNDQRAWDRLIAQFTPTIRGIARRHRLTTFDQDDVLQQTWIALIRHIGDIREPSSIGAWLAAIARRECLRIIAERTRQFPTEDTIEHESPQSVPDDYLRQERKTTVRLAAASLSRDQRALVLALSIEPALSYEQISQKLSIPIGSIGPTRQRCFTRMRNDPRILGLRDEYAPPQRPTRPVRPPIELV